MDFTKDFTADLATLLAELDSGRPFAFNRFWDGELAILEERDIPTADGWSAVNVSDKFRERLKAALTYRDKDYYVGLGCPCCYRDEWERLMKLSGRTPDDPQVTFSTLFVNGNYETWLLAERFGVWWKGQKNLVNCDLSEIDRAIDSIEQSARQSGFAAASGRVRWPTVFFAAGPAAKIMIHELHLRRVQTPLVDIGSSLDSSGRSYHDPNHPNRKKICQWTPKTIDNTASSSI